MSEVHTFFDGGCKIVAEKVSDIEWHVTLNSYFLYEQDCHAFRVIRGVTFEEIKPDIDRMADDFKKKLVRSHVANKILEFLELIDQEDVKKAMKQLKFVVARIIYGESAAPIVDVLDDIEKEVRTWAEHHKDF